MRPEVFITQGRKAWMTPCRVAYHQGVLVSGSGKGLAFRFRHRLSETCQQAVEAFAPKSAQHSNPRDTSPPPHKKIVASAPRCVYNLGDALLHLAAPSQSSE